MKINKASMFALGAVSAGVLTLGTIASAYGGETDSGQKPGRLFQNHAGMHNLMEAGNYDAWKATLEEKGMEGPLAQIDAETFAKMVEAHKLMEAGSVKEAQAIHEELGLAPFNKFGRRHMGQMPGQFKAVHSAMESGDYAAFKEAVGDNGPGEFVTEENFDRFVEMHRLIQAGDKDGAKAIAEEIGLPERPKMMRKEGRMQKSSFGWKKNTRLEQK
jgi:hypothetical protein